MDSNSKKNLWDLKPFWCQPWSIISFGILVFVLAWNLFNNIVINSILGFIIIIWWIIFLILAPIAYQGTSEEK